MKLGNVLRLAAALTCAVAGADPASAASYRVVHSFQGEGVDGTEPRAALIAVDGMLYGTTEFGGPSGSGTVFRIDPTTNTTTIVHAFQNDGHDGKRPRAALLRVGTALFGTTSLGGDFGGGTVFRVNIPTGREFVVHSFGGDNDGAEPRAALINVNGTLYGTTSTDTTTKGGGTVFKMNPVTGAVTVLHFFQYLPQFGEGAFPYGSLLNFKGMLYGTASFGGFYNDGTIFRTDPATGETVILHPFAGAPGDGATPYAGLINVGGRLYGTTRGGARYDGGAVFRVDPDPTAPSVELLFPFGGSGTANLEPVAPLLRVPGFLYGTASRGGQFGFGAVFRTNPKNGGTITLHDFTGPPGDGAVPEAGLLNVNGTLYGTTTNGGTYDRGTVFAITP